MTTSEQSDLNKFNQKSYNIGAGGNAGEGGVKIPVKGTKESRVKQRCNNKKIQQKNQGPNQPINPYLNDRPNNALFPQIQQQKKIEEQPQR
jgi:hypothetical protein